MTGRVIVVGAGIVGLTTAWFLHGDGAEVVVLDQRDGAAAGASFANGGLLTPSFSEPWNSPGVFWQMLRWLGDDTAPLLLRPSALPGLWRWGSRFIAASRPARFEQSLRANARLALYSLDQLEALRAALGQDARARSGSLKIFRSEAAAEAGMARADIYRAAGIALDLVDRRGLLALEPALEPVADRLVAALHCPLDDSGDARRMSEDLAADLVMRGVAIRFGCAVRGIVIGPGDATVHVDGDGGQPDVLSADRIVVAGGAWSDALTRPAGVRLALAPVKGYSISVPMEAVVRPRVPVLDEAFHAVATPLGSVMRVAGTAEFAGFDARLAPERIANLVTLLGHVYPAMARDIDMSRAGGWTGFRPVSADGVPFIGPTRVPRLFVNSGHGPLGWTMAAGSARLLADLIAGRMPALPLAPYRADRL